MALRLFSEQRVNQRPRNCAFDVLFFLLLLFALFLYFLSKAKRPPWRGLFGFVLVLAEALFYFYLLFLKQDPLQFAAS